MGGPGSGAHYYQWWRSSKKTVVEDCRQLDVNRFIREGLLAPGIRQSGGWSWYRGGNKEPTSSIGYEVCTLDMADPWLRLHYTFTVSGQAIDSRIRLTTTRLRFGGLRWWFICPLIVGGRPCNRRVGKVYLPPHSRYFGCRDCHELTYTSCQESRRFDGLYRHIARNTGQDLRTVKRVMRRLGKLANG
jgi:hypothetical protein